MQVLGLDPVIITTAICIIGVSYQIITGMLGKSWKQFNPNLAATTFMLGIVTSIGLVAPVIDALPDDMSPVLQLAAIAGQVALVMGIDGAVRKGQKISKKIQSDLDSTELELEPEPIDNPSDLPPGKENTN